MTIILDTPAQISAWVLLSRRSQIKMHLGIRPNGEKASVKIPQKGLLKCLKSTIPGCEDASRVEQCIVPVEYAISQAGLDIDYSIVNIHIMTSNGGLFFDRGIFANEDDVSDYVSEHPAIAKAYDEGRLEIVLTREDVRPKNDEIFVPA